jgi:copper chaperone CopZ
MSNAMTIKDLGLTAKSTGVDDALESATGGCGDGCVCTCGADDADFSTTGLTETADNSAAENEAAAAETASIIAAAEAIPVVALVTPTGSVAAQYPVTEYRVSGMTCNHCVMSVSEELFDLDDVKNVSVELVTGGESIVSVASVSPLDRQAVRAAVEVAGYHLVED